MTATGAPLRTTSISSPAATRPRTAEKWRAASLAVIRITSPTYRISQMSGLVPEVPAAGEDHHRAGALHRGGYLGVPLGAPGLDDRRDAGVERDLGAVREGEEAIRRQDRPLHVVPARARLLDGEPDGVHTARLPGADAERLQILRDHDRIRRDVPADAPGEQEVAPARLVGLA